MTNPTLKNPVLLAWTTCPDEASAKALAAALVEARLATCVNRVGGVNSTYFWKGRVHEDTEILLIMKTTAARLPELEARLMVLHPYEMPELLAVEIVDGNENYLDWVRKGVALPDRG